VRFVSGNRTQKKKRNILKEQDPLCLPTSRRG
jgi:hypothetical protein